MGFVPLVKSCENLFVKAPFAQTLPKDFTKTIKSGKLKLCPNFKGTVGDVAHFTETTFKKPSAEKLKELLEKAGIKSTDTLYKADGTIPKLGAQDIAYINDNNSLFFEKLLELFPKKAEETVNTAVQKRMLYLSDIDHSKFVDKHKFLEQFLKDVDDVENIMANDGKKLYGDYATELLYSKKAILQAKYNNPERYKELTDLISLHQKGLVPRHNVQFFFPEGHFHPLIKGDMQKLLTGECYYPQFEKLLQEAISQLEHGEAFSVGEKMFVKTLTGYEELKIDKATYEKLFPAVERYAISQNRVGNCGKISSWNAIIKNPNSRVELYKMFEQTPNGVKVNMPHCGYNSEFNWAELPDMNTPENLQGCLGHKMLEYTHDMNFLREIDTVGDPRPELVTRITGLLENKQYRNSYRLDEEWINNCTNQERNGIYVKNGGDENMNIGLTEGHYYSTTDLSTGLWQNPWTGVEEVTLEKDLCLSGSMHSYI